MYNFWARKKECSSVFQIQSMDMWRNISLNNWDYLFCPIQRPNCKDSCFVLNPFKTRQELLQSHLNWWARDLMLESQLHSEAMTCAELSGIQIGVAIMHFWDSMSPLIFLPFMRDLKMGLKKIKLQFKSSAMGVVQIIWGLWKRFLLALPVLKKH